MPPVLSWGTPRCANVAKTAMLLAYCVVWKCEVLTALAGLIGWQPDWSPGDHWLIETIFSIAYFQTHVQTVRPEVGPVQCR